MNRTRALAILSGEDRSLSAGLMRTTLTIAEPGYQFAVQRRNRKFDTGSRPATPLGRPTLSVGNITTGGTGKTPTVIDLAQRLLQRNQRPAILLRGYRSKDGISDEAEELRAALPGTPVMPNPSRIDGAKQVLADHPDVTHFLLDDGFQHRQAHRDVDLVLIDATNPFGYDHLLPRGLLREPKANLTRADAVIVTRADRVDAEALAQLDLVITQLTGTPPLAHTAHQWTGFDAIYEQLTTAPPRIEELPLSSLKSMSVIAVSGIGNPQAFEASVSEHAGKLLTHHRFDDHYSYDQATVKKIYENAMSKGADAIIMTAKDKTKWPQHLADEYASLIPIFIPVLGLAYLDGEPTLAKLLDAFAQRSGA